MTSVTPETKLCNLRCAPSTPEIIRHLIKAEHQHLHDVAIPPCGSNQFAGTSSVVYVGVHEMWRAYTTHIFAISLMPCLQVSSLRSSRSMSVLAPCLPLPTAAPKNLCTNMRNVNRQPAPQEAPFAAVVVGGLAGAVSDQK